MLHLPILLLELLEPILQPFHLLVARDSQLLDDLEDAPETKDDDQRSDFFEDAAEDDVDEERHDDDEGVEAVKL